MTAIRLPSPQPVSKASLSISFRLRTHIMNVSWSWFHWFHCELLNTLKPGQIFSLLQKQVLQMSESILPFCILCLINIWCHLTLLLKQIFSTSMRVEYHKLIIILNIIVRYPLTYILSRHIFILTGFLIILSNVLSNPKLKFDVLSEFFC